MAPTFEFETLTSSADVAALMTLVHGLFNRLAALPVLAAAGIDGIAVGGGLELALPCDHLFVTGSPKTKLGFPEVNLGILPGYGGTGRAFARIGTGSVLDMMLSGRPLGSKAALDHGLADHIVDESTSLQPAMRDWILGQNGVKPKRQPVDSAADSAALATARDSYLKRLRPDHVPAPFAIADHVERHGHVPQCRQVKSIFS